MAYTDWQNQKNPDTGRPFGSYDEWNNYQYGLGQKTAATASSQAADRAGFAGTYNTDYTFTPSTWSVDASPSNGYIFFGDSSNGDKKRWVDSDDPFRKINYGPEMTAGGTMYNDAELNKRGFYYVPAQGGYINPKTGEIVYGGNDLSKGGTWSDQTSTTKKQYYYDQDYGLGSQAKGIIPIEFDRKGTPVKFYAGTPGGGGQVFTDLAQAQASVAAYKSWYDEKHPAGTAGSQIAPSTYQTPPGGTSTPSTSGTQTNGLLTNPGQSEQYFDSTKDFYGKGPVLAGQAFADKPTQPTASEQYWNAQNGKYQTPGTAESDMWDQWKGEFASPDALKGVYQRGQDAAQRTLDRKSASAGWGDSGAAARATGNIGQQFTDAYVKAEQDFAKTGMGLAGASDTSQDTKVKTGAGLAAASDAAKNAQTKSWLDTANTAQGIDTSKLAFTTAGQASANAAQNAQETRLTGGFDRSMQIAQNMAMLTNSGLNSASSQTMAYNMADLQMQLAQGNMTYAQSEAKLKEYAAAMGVVGTSLTALLSNWKKQNGGASSGDTYQVQTINY